MASSHIDSAFPPSRNRAPDPMTEDIERTCDLPPETTADLDIMAVNFAGHGTRSIADSPVSQRLRALRERRAAAHEDAERPTAEPSTPRPSQPPPTPEQVVTTPTPRRSNVVAPGHILSDRYLIEQRIGMGGTSMVFRARDMLATANAGPRPQVAVKTPRPDADRKRVVARLQREYDCLRALSHPHIVQAYEMRCDSEECFLTLELLEGRSLAALQREWTPFPTALAHKVLDATGRALIHAHAQGITHGDFTPGNVLLTNDEGVKVLDFGAAALASQDDRQRVAAGTRTYASPEVLAGLAPEPRDDLFSFACVAYELLVGRHPFERRSSLEARDAEIVPPRAWSLTAAQWLALMSALAWKRMDRCTSIDALLATLRQTQRSAERAAAATPSLSATRPGARLPSPAVTADDDSDNNDTGPDHGARSRRKLVLLIAASLIATAMLAAFKLSGV